MLRKIKHNNSKKYLIIYNKMEGNLILKYLNVLTCLNFLIQTKLVLLNIMEEVVILEDSHHMEEAGEDKVVVLEEDNKVEVHQVVQGIKKHLFLLATWLIMQIQMK